MKPFEAEALRWLREMEGYDGDGVVLRDYSLKTVVALYRKHLKKTKRFVAA